MPSGKTVQMSSKPSHVFGLALDVITDTPLSFIMAEEMRVLEEDLTCALCLDLYRDPHLLPCGHNFCISCLQQLKSNSEHSRLRCPECRQTHHCSVSWQKNFKLASIANGYRCRSKPQVPSCKSVKVPCDYCPPGAADTAEESVSVKTCLKCDVSMCLEHVKPHLELPTFREHPLVEPLGNIKLRKCAEHDEMFRYYCLDERVFLCYACTIEGGHKEHRIKTLKNAMQDLKASLGKQLQKADKQIRRVEKTMQRQKEVEHENKAFLEEADRKFHALRDALSSRLESLLVSLQGCVHGSQAGSDHSVQQNLARITVDRSRLDEAHAGIQQLMQENDPLQFMKEYSSCAKRYRQILRRPLFDPHSEEVDRNALTESVEGVMEEFMTDVQEHISTLVFTAEEGDEGVEEDEGDSNEDSGSEEVEHDQDDLEVTDEDSSQEEEDEEEEGAEEEGEEEEEEEEEGVEEEEEEGEEEEEEGMKY